LGLDPINSGAKKSGTMFLNDAALKKNNNSITKKEMVLVEIFVLFHDLL